MAGTWHKMAVYLGLVEEDLDGDYTTEESRPRGRETYSETVESNRARPTKESAHSSIVTTGAIPTVGAPGSAAAATAIAERPVPAAVAVTPAGSTPKPAAAFPPRPSVTSPIHEADDEPTRIVTLHPRSYNDARRIGEEYRDGAAVLVNLTGMEDADAKRIVDFAAGLIFGLRGSIERITNKVFLLSPANVDVGAEARAQIAQDGFFAQS